MYIEKRMQHSAFFCKRMKRSCFLLRSLQKNVAFFAFFYVLCKRTLRSLRSFAFFSVLFCSLEKNGKECSILLGLISRQKLEKRTKKNVAFFKRTEKKETFRTEKNMVPNPALS